MTGAKGDELVTNGTKVRGYDPATGALTAAITLNGAAIAQAIAGAAMSSGIILTANAVAQSAAQGALEFGQARLFQEATLGARSPEVVEGRVHHKQDAERIERAFAAGADPPTAPMRLAAGNPLIATNHALCAKLADLIGIPITS